MSVGFLKFLTGYSIALTVVLIGLGFFYSFTGDPGLGFIASSAAWATMASAEFWTLQIKSAKVRQRLAALLAEEGPVETR